MSHDGFPADADPRALAAVFIAGRDQVAALITIYPASCECTLGRVYRINGVTVLTGVTVARLLVGIVEGRDRMERRPMRYAVLLDDPDRPVDLACLHGGAATGELLDETLNRIRAAVATVERTGAVLIL